VAPKGSWCSNFLLAGSKEQTDDNIELAVRARFPRFYSYIDVYDSIGIYFYYIQRVQVLDRPNVMKVHKGLKVEHAHKIAQRVIQLPYGEPLIPTEQEATRIQKYGCREFIYNEDMLLDRNCRALTTQYNCVWWGEIPEHKYIHSIWWRYNVKPDPTKGIYVVTYRLYVK
jgi:hypothetical protein